MSTPSGASTAALSSATQRSADAVFNNFLDLIGRPDRRVALPSRGMPTDGMTRGPPRGSLGQTPVPTTGV
jgi:hypothetical protein